MDPAARPFGIVFVVYIVIAIGIAVVYGLRVVHDDVIMYAQLAVVAALALVTGLLGWKHGMTIVMVLSVALFLASAVVAVLKVVHVLNIEDTKGVLVASMAVPALLPGMVALVAAWPSRGGYAPLSGDASPYEYARGLGEGDASLYAPGTSQDGEQCSVILRRAGVDRGDRFVAQQQLTPHPPGTAAGEDGGSSVGEAYDPNQGLLTGEDGALQYEYARGPDEDAERGSGTPAVAGSRTFAGIDTSYSEATRERSAFPYVPGTPAGEDERLPVGEANDAHRALRPFSGEGEGVAASAGPSTGHDGRIEGQILPSLRTPSGVGGGMHADQTPPSRFPTPPPPPPRWLMAEDRGDTHDRTMHKVVRPIDMLGAEQEPPLSTPERQRENRERLERQWNRLRDDGSDLENMLADHWGVLMKRVVKTGKQDLRVLPLYYLEGWMRYGHYALQIIESIAKQAENPVLKHAMIQGALASGFITPELADDIHHLLHYVKSKGMTFRVDEDSLLASKANMNLMVSAESRRIALWIPERDRREFEDKDIVLAVMPGLIINDDVKREPNSAIIVYRWNDTVDDKGLFTQDTYNIPFNYVTEPPNNAARRGSA